MAGKAVKSVFDKYAHEYDLITNAEQREAYHAEEVAALIDRFAPTSVLDAGCATGLTAALFARNGVRAVGLDRSREMLRVARQNYTDTPLPLSFRFGHFEKLPANLAGRFDLVVCLANSISGVASKKDLRLCFNGFRRVLRPGGSLVLQMLNYSSIKENEPMPIKVTENGGIIYIRYSIRRASRLTVHVVRLDMRAKDAPRFEPFVHEFGNFTPEIVRGLIGALGFNDLREFSDLYLSRRFGPRSRDFVITAKRPK
ncbi:MAG: methyltransferase domain-containing protein [Candidatus Zixiibacteriota bacterium]|nr:MAG: methyltransferase domain-containing protein [candidate division Zixibacteria bacterium]